MAPGGVLKGAGGGDGGLFAGITARYLALAANELPDDGATRSAARDIVLASATAAWDNRADVDGLPLFAAFWDRTAEVPGKCAESGGKVDGAVFESPSPERDLSVQVSGWMLMEAANTVSGSG